MTVTLPLRQQSSEADSKGNQLSKGKLFVIEIPSSASTFQSPSESVWRGILSRADITIEPIFTAAAYLSLAGFGHEAAADCSVEEAGELENMWQRACSRPRSS